MLVLKRALSLAISTALAFPVNVWARSEQPHAPHAKPAHTKGFVAVDKPSTKQKSVKVKTSSAKPLKAVSAPSSKFKAVASAPLKNAGRKPASQNSKDNFPEAGKVLSATMPKKGGKHGDYQVSFVPGKGKRLKSRVLTKGDFREIMVDEDEDGTADVFERTRGSLTMKAYRPYRGNFTHIEYTDRRAESMVITKFLLDPRKKGYQLLSVNVEPYRLMNESTVNRNGVVTGELCEVDARSLGGFEKFLEDLRKKMGGPKQSAVECKLKRFQDALFDKSCDDKKEFRESKEKMIAGLADLIASRGSEPPKLLQCLEKKGYAYHSNKITEKINAYLHAARTTLKENSNWTDDQFDDNSCDRLETVQVKKPTGELEEKPQSFQEVFAKKYPPLFQCRNFDGAFGSYDPKSARIFLKAPAAKMEAGYSIAAPDAYASLMMHELLHSTGINENEETLIKNLQVCCAVSSASSEFKSAACNAVDSRQRSEQTMAKVSQLSGYPQFYMKIQEQLGTQASDFIDTWALNYLETPEGKESTATYGRCYKAAGQDADAQNKCGEALMKDLQAYTPKYLADRCPDFKKYRGTQNVDCNKLKGAFDDFERAIAEDANRGFKNLLDEPLRPITVIDVGELQISRVDTVKLDEEIRASLAQYDFSDLQNNTENPAARGVVPVAPTQPTQPTQPLTQRPPTQPNQPTSQTGTTVATNPQQPRTTTNRPTEPTNTRTGGGVTFEDEPETTTPTRTTQQQPQQPSTTQTQQQPQQQQPSTTQTTQNNPATTGGSTDASQTGGTRTGTSQIAGTQNRAAANGYIPEYSSPVKMQEATAASAQTAAPLGAEPVKTMAGFNTDRLDAYVQNIPTALGSLVGSSTANAATAARFNAAIAPQPSRMPAGGPSYASSGSAPSAPASRSVAAASSSGGGSSRSSSSSSSSGRRGSESDSDSDSESDESSGGKSRSSKTAKREKSSKADADASADGDATADTDAGADDAGGAKVAASGSVRPGARALAGSGGAAPAAAQIETLGRQAISQPTRFVSSVKKAGASSVRALVRNAEFVEKLRQGGWGIQDGNRVIGYSNPDRNKLLVYCGDQVVLFGFCK
jgi:hypothetical protein